MKRLLFMSILVSSYAYCDDFISEVDSLNQQIGQTAIENYLHKPVSSGLPGPFIESMIPHEPHQNGEVCLIDEEPKSSNLKSFWLLKKTLMTRVLKFYQGRKLNSVLLIWKHS